MVLRARRDPAVTWRVWQRAAAGATGGSARDVDTWTSRRRGGVIRRCAPCCAPDGIEVVRRLRSDDRTRSLPVVILTSSCEPRDITAGYTAGANSYVRKPVDAVEFGEAVVRVVTYWLQLNESPGRR
jgi:FixJ family two-component response regulator